MCMIQEITGASQYSVKYRNCWRVLVAMIRRRVCDFGENSKDSGRGEAQQTGCTS